MRYWDTKPRALHNGRVYLSNKGGSGGKGKGEYKYLAINFLVTDVKVIKVIKALLHCQRSSLFSELHIVLFVRAKATQLVLESGGGVLWATHSKKTWWLPSVPVSVVCGGVYRLVQDSTAMVAPALSEAHCRLQGGPHTTKVPVRWPRSVMAACSGGEPRACPALMRWTPVVRWAPWRQKVFCLVMQMQSHCARCLCIQYGDRRKANYCN